MTVKREAGKWYVCLSVEYAGQLLPHSTETVRIDVGLTALATLSHGTMLPNPRHYQHAQAKLRRAQRRVARRQRGSHGRRKAVVLLQKAHAHVRTA